MQSSTARIPATARARVMLADDDLDFRGALKDALRADGYEVVDLPSGVSVSVFLDECTVRADVAPPIDVLITDLRMPDVNGLAVLDKVSQLGLSLPTIVITAFFDHRTKRDAEELGAAFVLPKPFELGVLEKMIDLLSSQPKRHRRVGAD